MKFGSEVMALKVTSTPYLLIPYFQAFQNGGRSDFWGGCKTCTSQRRTMTFCTLIIFKGWTTSNETIFVKNKKKYEHGGRLNVKIHSLFCGDNSWTVALRQMNFGRVRDHGHTYKFWVIILFDAVFKFGDSAKFWGYVGINAEPLCRIL
jgi:hypothetical protein